MDIFPGTKPRITTKNPFNSMYPFSFHVNPHPTIEKLIIVRVFGRLSSYTQKWVGLDCFFIARIFAILALISNLFVIYRRIIQISHDQIFLPADIVFQVFLWCSVRLLIPFSPMRPNSIAYKKLFAYTLASQGQKNIELLRIRMSYSATKMVVALAFVFTILDPVIHDMATFDLLKASTPIVTYWLAMAFCACTPDEPRKSKLREGLDKLKEKLSEVTIPGTSEPEPSPV